MRYPAFERLVWALSAPLQLAIVVAGADQSGRYDALAGNNQESACQLGQSIHEQCQTQSPGLDKTPIPSLCTCNNVFFNIWSACSYASGNNTLPVYSQWINTCNASSIDLAKSALMTTQNNALGISVPVWAGLPIPGNTSFDVQKAVFLAVSQGSKPWTILQIVLPAAAAVVAAILTAVCLIARTRRAQLKQGIKGFWYNLKPVPKVRDERQYDGFVIEQPPLPTPSDSFIPPQQHQHQPYLNVAPPPLLQRESSSTIPGHPSIPSTGIQGSIPGLDDTTRSPPVVPGGRVWPEGVIPPSPTDRSYPFALHPHQLSGSNTKSTTPVSSWRGWRVRDNVHLPRPWKSGPIRVKETKPGRGFRVDGSTEESTSVGQQSSRGHGDDSENLRGSFDVRRHVEGEDDLFDEPLHMDEQEHSEDEGTSLIPDGERISYMQTVESTEQGARFSGTVNSGSIESHIRVIPPSTVSSDSQRNTMVQAPGSRYLPPPIIPPLPRQAAPVPPAMPTRVPLRNIYATNNNAVSTSNAPSIPPNQTANITRQMTPIQEIEIRSASPSLASMLSRKISNGEVRPLPVPNTPPHGQHSFNPGIGLAHSASVSSSSVYEEQHSVEGSTHAHLRQNSGDSVRSVRPLPTPHGRNPSVSSGSNGRFLSPSREEQESDYFSAGGHSGRNSPYSGGQHRPLASDDSDDASFYVRSPQASQHHLPPTPLSPPHRTTSPMGMARTPPVPELPPGARAAGYRGAPRY